MYLHEFCIYIYIQFKFVCQSNNPENCLVCVTKTNIQSYVMLGTPFHTHFMHLARYSDSAAAALYQHAVCSWYFVVKQFVCWKLGHLVFITLFYMSSYC